MEKDFVYYTLLFDIYGNLLTKKQQDYFKEYYFNNLSLTEIAENYQVSRNAIHHQLKQVILKLENYENILHVALKNKKLESIIEEIQDKKLKEKLQNLIEM